MNRCPIRNGYRDVGHPPGIDLQCHPEDECELLLAAIMCEMSFLELVFIMYAFNTTENNHLVANVPKKPFAGFFIFYLPAFTACIREF